MRLALFWPAQVFFDGEHYTTHGFAQLWFGELARHFSSVDLIVPVLRTQSRRGPATLDTRNLRLLALPSASRGWQHYTTHLPLIVAGMLRLIRAHRHEWDRVLVYEVQPLSQIWFGLCRLAHLPTALYLGGRHDQAVLLRNTERGPVLRALATVWARWCRLIVPRMIQSGPVIVTGDDLQAVYARTTSQPVFSVTSSSVHDVEILDSLAQRQVVPAGGIPLVLAVCRVTPIKGLEHLIEAIGRLARDGRRIRLAVAGRQDQGYTQRLRRLARSCGIADDIQFLGPLPPGAALRALYDKADVFVLPSLSEGTPKVILEAMSRGLPVIATNVGGVPDLIEDGRTGLLVSAGSSTELADALERLLADSDLRQRLAAAALNVVRSITVEAQTARLAGIVKADGFAGLEPATV